jgi:hypothetical protein
MATPRGDCVVVDDTTRDMFSKKIVEASKDLEKALLGHRWSDALMISQSMTNVLYAQLSPLMVETCEKGLPILGHMAKMRETRWIQPHEGQVEFLSAQSNSFFLTSRALTARDAQHKRFLERHAIGPDGEFWKNITVNAHGGGVSSSGNRRKRKRLQNRTYLPVPPDRWIVIDGANVGNLSGAFSPESLTTLVDQLFRDGYENLKVVLTSAHARCTQRIMPPEHLHTIVETKGNAHDDIAVLSVALKLNAFVLSNDRYRDHREKFHPDQWQKMMQDRIWFSYVGGGDTDRGWFSLQCQECVNKPDPNVEPTVHY